MRAIAAGAIALGLATAACGGADKERDDKKEKEVAARIEKKPKKIEPPKETTMPPLSIDCAAPVEPHAYELAKIVEANDLRAPATEGPIRLAAGPMLGAISDTSVKVWLRMDRPAPWRVTIWPAKAAGKKRVVEGALPAQEHDFTSTLDVGELTPNSAYTYQVEIGATGKDGVKLPQRSFRTLAASGKSGKLRFAVGGHIAGDMDGSIFTQIEQAKPDFLVLLGDLIFSEGLPATFRAYADKYTSNWNIPELRELVQSVPTFMIWDDQEIKRGYYSGSSTTRYQPARLAYELYAQAHNPAPTLPGALHYQFRAGDVSFFVLDARSHRRSPKDENGPKKTMLGDAQKAELARFLKCDPSKIKVVVSPVMFAGPARGNQSWTVYRQEREQLLSFIRSEKVDNVIVLSGDQQWSGVLKHQMNGTRIYELLSTPLSKDIGMAPGKESKAIIARDDDHHVFGVVDVDTKAKPATIAFTLCARGKPCKPGHEPAPTTAMDVEGEQDNVPFTITITEEHLGPKPEPVAATEPAKAEAPAKKGKPARASADQAAKTATP